MASVSAFTSAGAKSTSKITLDKAVFGVPVDNHELLKSAYVAYLANSRVSLAKAKTRGEVRGSTRKPWRQKGTGRARFGSRYNPIWRGGGITFGPTGEENYRKKINVKAKRQAIRQALTLAADSGKVIVVDSFKPKENKTSSSAKFLEKIGASRSTLLVVADKTDQIDKSTRNLSDVVVTQAKYLNVYDVLNATFVVIEKEALQIITDWLGGTK